MQRQASRRELLLRPVEGGRIEEQTLGLNAEEAADLFQRRHIGQGRAGEIFVELLAVHAQRAAHGGDRTMPGAQRTEIVGEVLVRREGRLLVHRSTPKAESSVSIRGPAVMSRIRLAYIAPVARRT
jgi:hypothetical protein